MRSLNLIFVFAILISNPTLAEDFFTIGSNINLVKQLHGEPEKKTKGPLMGEESWWYGDSYVTISIYGTVAAWEDSPNYFKKRLIPGKDTASNSYFTQGSLLSDVIRLHGTPDRIIRQPFVHEVTLHYGQNTVTIATSTGTVARWSDITNELKDKIKTDSDNSPD